MMIFNFKKTLDIHSVERESVKIIARAVSATTLAIFDIKWNMVNNYNTICYVW